MIAALAGLRRLGREHRVSEILDPAGCLPAAGRGRRSGLVLDSGDALAQPEQYLVHRRRRLGRSSHPCPPLAGRAVAAPGLRPVPPRPRGGFPMHDATSGNASACVRSASGHRL
ncbi:hypothetical protein [Streptomyces toxytricini]|uniref:hypothetical protein n=1 Tax=Streptomyces toxytricini TaxID=67369 RepID=UPI00341813CA